MVCAKAGTCPFFGYFEDPRPIHSRKLLWSLTLISRAMKMEGFFFLKKKNYKIKTEKIRIFEANPDTDICYSIATRPQMYE